MKAFAQHRNRFNRVLCCVLSFTLAFYTLSTPAFAAEAAEATPSNAATQQAGEAKTTINNNADAQQTNADKSADNTNSSNEQDKAADVQTKAGGDQTKGAKVDGDAQDSDSQATDAEKQPADEPEDQVKDPATENDQVSDDSNGDMPEVEDVTDAAITTAEDGNGEENPGEFDYEQTPDPEHTVSISSSFDPDSLTIIYTVTVDNSEGDVPLNEMALEVFEKMDDQVNPFVVLPAPAGWHLGAHQTDTLTFTHKLDLVPTTDVPVEVNLKVKAVAENNAYAVGENDIECLMPLKAHDYEVDASSFVVDESGNKRSADEYALLGDVIYFTFTVRNTGAEALEFTASPDGAVEIVEGSDGYASWGDTHVLASGAQLTFAASHLATEEDLVEGDSEADTSIGTKIKITTAEGTEEYSASSAKIMESFYQYYVFFAIDTEDDEVASQIADLDIIRKQSDVAFSWPVDYIVEHCPEGFVPRYSVMLDDELVAVDPTISIDLTHDDKQNCFYVDYVLIPEVEQAPYTVNYYIDSVDGMTIAADSGIGSVGDAIPVDVAGHCPEGFKADATISGPATICTSQDGSENTVSVVYERDSFGYTINYFMSDSMGAITSLGSAQGEKTPFESTVTLTSEQLNAKLPSSGYPELAPSNAYSLVITADEASNVIDITYAPDNYTYSIDYYSKNSEGAVTFLGSTMGAPAPYGTVVTLNAEQLNANHQAGYKTLAVSDAYSLTISDNEDANRIEVVYEPDVFTYTIKYYRDAANDDFDHMVGETLVGEALYGSTVHVDIDMLNRNLPDIGFAAKDKDDEFDILITEDAALNSYNVVYERMKYGYVVAYYQDSVSPENYLGATMDSYYYGYEVTLDPIEANKFLPVGYEGIKQFLYLTIKSSNMDDNVLNIVYDQKVNNIGYTVNYYKDGIAEENLLGSDTGVGLFDADIPYEMGKYVPAGYDSNGEVTGNDVISLDPSTNVVNIVYSKGKIAYTVNYYKDDVADDNFLNTQTGSAELGEPIPYENGLYAPEEGYDLANTVTKGQSIVTASPEDNVLNVIYSRQANLSWRVNYYLGAVSGSPVASITGFGTYGDEIPYDADAYVTDGYTLPAQINGDNQIVNVTGESVLNVVYPRGSFNYTVKYYKDSISEDNLLGIDSATGLFGSTIPYEQGKYAPIGYRSVGYTNGTLTVGYDSQSNVLNVVYLYESYGFTVNYYVGSVASDNLVESVSNPEDLRPYGSTVELRPSQMNAHRPAGYAAITEPMSFVITDDVATNGCNVVFTPDFGEFYTAGVPAVSATYDGMTHSIEASGVHEGDIVTYTYNGTTETRTVGIDPYIGVEFQDVTDGAIPVTVQVTRAGITSNAVQTTVNIAPTAPVVPNVPQNPVTPNAPAASSSTDAIIPNTSNGSNSIAPSNEPSASNHEDELNQTNGNTNAEDQSQANQPVNNEHSIPASIASVADAVAESPLGQIVDRLVSYVDPGIDVPEPITAELNMDGDQDATTVESIADDINPLAAEPSAPENSMSGTASTILLALSTLSAIASAVFVFLKLSISSHIATMGSTASVAIKGRACITTRLLTASVSLALVFFVAWVIMLL